MYMDLKIRVNQPPRETILRNQEGKHKVLARKNVIVGMDDDVVDPFKVIEWLFKNKPYSNLIAVDGMSHRYSQEQFVNAVDCIVAKWLV
jgi:hypothetical protein